jgi:hypothetical protein
MIIKLISTFVKFINFDRMLNVTGVARNVTQNQSRLLKICQQFLFRFHKLLNLFVEPLSRLKNR